MNEERTAAATTTIRAMAMAKYIATVSIVMVENQFFSPNKLYFMHSYVSEKQ